MGTGLAFSSATHGDMRKLLKRWGAPQMAEKAGSAFGVNDWTLNLVDPDGLKYVTRVLVWVHWFMGVALLLVLVYRPGYGLGRTVGFGLALLLFMACNAWLHHRLASGRTPTWRWIFAMYWLDVAMISVAAVLGGGFSHYFFHLVYYPVLAGFAVFFSSFRLNMAFVTAVAGVYLILSLTVGDGIDLEAREEKPLLVRILVMYVVVACVNLVSRFERVRWRAAVERERELQRQRVEISQTIHDTTAQWAYMVGLGIEGALDLVDESDHALIEKLRLVAALSRSAMWELRHPIDGGQIFRGEMLGEVLESHATTFTAITSVPAALEQLGREPPLSIIHKSLLFSIAHNALTNVIRHAEARQVVIGLEYTDDELRLSVSDDGMGLPSDYEARGHGFRNMRADAERMGGFLDVVSDSNGGGTTVTCAVPCRTLRGGD